MIHFWFEIILFLCAVCLTFAVFGMIGAVAFFIYIVWKEIRDEHNYENED